MRAARGRTRRRLHNRLKRSKLAAKIHNIFSWQENALRDPRRSGSDDVAGDAHSIDEEREADAQPVAGAVLLKLGTRTMPLLLYVLVPRDFKKRPSATVFRPKEVYRHALERHKSLSQTPSTRRFFNDAM